MDTVALCGGVLDDRHAWMFDAVDIQTTWNEMRALPNRGQKATLEQIQAVEDHLPFPLRGVDSDNGGEFINHHLVRHFQLRSKPVAFTRSRPYKKNDNAHIEQKNYTQVRLWFGYERYDNPAVVPLMNALCTGALHQFLNYFLPTMKLQSKERVNHKTVRHYESTQTPLQRVLQSSSVDAEKKALLSAEKARLNPFDLRRQIEVQLKTIDQIRREPEA